MMTAVRDAAAASPASVPGGSSGTVHPVISEALHANGEMPRPPASLHSQLWKLVAQLVLLWMVMEQMELLLRASLGPATYRKLILDEQDTHIASFVRHLIDRMPPSKKSNESAAHEHSSAPAEDSAVVRQLLNAGEFLLQYQPRWRANQQWRLDQRHRLVTFLRSLPVLGGERGLLAPLLRPHTLCTFEAIAWLRCERLQDRLLYNIARLKHSWERVFGGPKQ
jgi:hypothetical protein